MKLINRLIPFILLFLTLAGCTPARQLTTSAPQATTRTPAAQIINTATATSTSIPVRSTATPAASPVPTTLPAPTATPLPVLTATSEAAHVLVVTNAQGEHISLVDPTRGVMAQIEAGTAPWGLALAADHRLYVATAEGVAVIDLNRRQRLALIPYQAAVGPPQYGEYRPGGMGIAASADGKQVYVAVYAPGESGRLEILDTETLTIVGSVPVGSRPFEVLVSAEGQEVYTIDHDTYSITVIDPLTLASRTLDVAPLGRGAFDKPHYAALDGAGQLWLPFQGQALVRLDPTSGQFTTTPLTADTHQHGIAQTPDGRYLLIVGTGAAGGAGAGPSLTIFDTRTMTEEVLPLNRPHEDVAVSPDGKYAYLTGGYLLSGGWEGLTVVDLQSRALSELAVAGFPLDIIALSPLLLQDADRDQAANMEQLNMELIAAAKAGDLTRVQNLLDRGASVRASDDHGLTALIGAAYQNHLAVAELLIQAGADVNVQDNTRQSAYLITTSEGYLDLLKLTLQAGADVHSLDSFNGTGLIRAADRGHVEIIAELLKTDIEVDHINRLGWTALLEAIILGDGGPEHTEVVRLLVQAGADVNLADRSGVTPLAHARRRGFEEIIAILESAGAG